MVAVLVLLGLAALALDPLLDRMGMTRSGFHVYECHEAGGSYPVELPGWVEIPRDHRSSGFTWVRDGNTFYIAATVTSPNGESLGTGVWTGLGEHEPRPPLLPANDLAHTFSTSTPALDPSPDAVHAAAACAERH